MRVTQSQVFQTNLNRLRESFAQLAESQERITTGKRLNRPSDDPASIRPLLDVRASRNRIEQVLQNVGLVQADLAGSESALRDMSNILARAMELTSTGANGSVTQADRDGIATEADGLLQQVLTLANTQGVTGFLFGGAVQDRIPFELVPGSGRERVQYHGDDQVISVDLGFSNRLARNLPGSRLFATGVRQPTVYVGSTGARAGSGVDSARGSGLLDLRHTLTTLAPGSGVQVGGSSAARDTVLGTTHSLTVLDTSGTGTAGTVSLNGGPPVAWTQADMDLAVTSADGDVVHLDFAAVTAGFNGSIALAGQGTASLDGGATTTALDFSAANQLLVDSETGGSIFLDATGILRSGQDLLRFPGTFDPFTALIELRDVLRNEDGLSADDQQASIQALLPELQRAQESVLTALADVGARTRLADMTEARATELDLVLLRNQADLEDTDFAEAAADLARAETVLEATLALSNRIANLPSLLQIL